MPFKRQRLLLIIDQFEDFFFLEMDEVDNLLSDLRNHQND